MQAYSDPTREADPHALPDIEVFYAGDGELELPDGEFNDKGWFYWFRFPGCMPDSEPIGPFDSKAAALADAQSS